MLQTFLFDTHIKNGAKMVPFAGYSMPVSYSSIKEEYLSVRSNTGLFDVSHMGIIFITSNSVENILLFLNYVTPRIVDSINIGDVQYNAVTSETGGLIDDITIFRIEEKRYMLIANASNKNKVYEHLNNCNHQLNNGVDIKLDIDRVLICIQGPESEQKLLPVLLNYISEIDKIKKLFYYQCCNFFIQNEECIISRTGYTGEDGFELLLPKNIVKDIWNHLLINGVRLCGLASRDLLRLEVFYSLYGSELIEERTPIESGLKRLINIDKNFIGKEAIVSKKYSKNIIGFICIEEGIPRKDYNIFIKKNENFHLIGSVTSGSFSFNWNCGFGLAFVDIEYAINNQEAYIDIRNQKKKIKFLTKTPYKGSIKLLKKAI